MTKRNLMNVTTAILLILSFTSLAQTKEKVKYYFPLNQATEHTIHEVSDFELNIQYNDRYGSSKELRFNIYEEHKQIVSLSCGEDQKKINTVFVEEFAIPSFTR